MAREKGNRARLDYTPEAPLPSVSGMVQVSGFLKYPAGLNPAYQELL